MLEETRGEIVERPAPGLPLVGGALGLEDDVPDPGLIQRLVHLFDHGGETLLGRAGAQPKETHPAMKSRHVGKHAIISSLQVEVGKRRSAE